jgi:hypothetical protein
MTPMQKCMEMCRRTWYINKFFDVAGYNVVHLWMSNVENLEAVFALKLCTYRCRSIAFFFRISL